MKNLFKEIIARLGYLNCVLFHHSDKMWTRVATDQQKNFCCECKREGIVPWPSSK